MSHSTSARTAWCMPPNDQASASPCVRTRWTDSATSTARSSSSSDSVGVAKQAVRPLGSTAASEGYQHGYDHVHSWQYHNPSDRGAGSSFFRAIGILPVAHTGGAGRKSCLDDRRRLSRSTERPAGALHPILLGADATS